MATVTGSKRLLNATYATLDANSNLTFNSDVVATQAWVTNNVINAAPGALDTLNELAAALGDDPNFATTVTNSIATKLSLSGGTMTGNLVLKSISGTDGTVENTHGGYLHLGGWGVGRTDATAVLVNTAYRADILSTTRNIALSGDVTGNANFNGGSDITITATVADNSHNHNEIKTVSTQTSGYDFNDLYANNTLRFHSTYATTGSWTGSTVTNYPTSPTATAYAYGITISAKNSGQGSLQMYAPHNQNNQSDIFFRTGWNTDYKAWARIWTDRNDGSGSGLDADLLDGQHASAFLTSLPSHNHDDRYYTETESDGRYWRTTRSVSVTSSNPFDDAHTATQVTGTGNYVINYTGASAQLISSSTGGSASIFQIGAHYNGDDFYMRTRTDSSTWRTWKRLWHAGNFNPASYLTTTGKAADSNLLDGLDSSAFLRSNANDTATGVISFNAGINTLSINDTSGQQLVICAGEAGIDASQTGELVYVNAENGFQVAASNDNWATGYGGTKKTIIDYGGIRYDGNYVWHAGNFNPSSYLTTTGKAADSNLLDGINSTQFIRNDLAANQVLTQQLTLRAHSNGWDGGLRLVSNDGAQYFQLHPDNNGNMYVDRQWYFSDGIKIGTLSGGHLEPYGDSMNVRKVNSISFAPNNSWNDPTVHGIMSTSDGGGAADSISINSYNDITLRLDANNNNAASYMRIMNNTAASSTIAYIGYDGGTNVAYFGGVATAANDFRAPIFYDSADTNYYLDPNSTSRIRRIDLIASGAGWNDGLNLYSSDGSNRWNLLVDNGQSDNLRFAYNNSEKVRFEAGGTIQLFGNTVVSGYAYATNYVHSNGEIYADGSIHVNRDGDSGNYLRLYHNRITRTGGGKITVENALDVVSTTAGSDVLAIDGVNGRLFTVTDDLTDSLFSVNTIAGLPIIEAFADQSIKLGPFTAPVEVTTTGELKVNGGTNLGTAVVGVSVSNDTITFTRANGGTFAVTTSDANTNYYLDNITKSGNTLTFVMNGKTDVTYEFGSLAFDSTTLGTAAAADTGDFATAAQGALADSALQSLPSHNHDGRYMRMDQDTHTTGGIEIRGSLSRGTYASASNYKTGADNIVLKGNSVGRSGIFFESEKDGTNINHASDFGFIQYHAYGTGTTGESNELIIGVSNDADDHLVLNAPNANGLKFRVGVGTTDYTVWHSGNDGTGSGLDADTLDGQHASAFLTSLPSHNHDSRYYTETEIDSFLSTRIQTWRGLYKHSGGYSGYYNNYVVAFSASLVNQTGQYIFKAKGRTSPAGTTHINIQAEIFVTDSGDIQIKSHNGTDDISTIKVIASTTAIEVQLKTVSTEYLNLSLELFTDTGESVSFNPAATLSGTTHEHTVVANGSNITGTAATTVSGGKFEGTASNADTVDSLHASSFFRRDAANDVDVRIAAAHGRGMRFWDSDSYKVYMSGSTSTGGARVAGETTSDYNMYFKMQGGGTNRGFVFITNNGAVAGIDGDGNGRFVGDVVAYSSSDRRLKDNLKPIENACEKVQKLTGYEFDWNKNQNVYQGHDIGVVAQEVEEVFPEVVEDRASGYKGVKYEKLVAVLIEANKELQDRVKQLEERIDGLTK